MDVEVAVDERGRAYVYERGSDGGRSLRFVVDRTSPRYTRAGIVAAIWTDYPYGLVHVRGDGTPHFEPGGEWLGWVLDIAREGGWEPEARFQQAEAHAALPRRGDPG